MLEHPRFPNILICFGCWESLTWKTPTTSLSPPLITMIFDISEIWSNMKADRFQMAQFETFQDLLHHSLLFVPPFFLFLVRMLCTGDCAVQILPRFSTTHLPTYPCNLEPLYLASTLTLQGNTSAFFLFFVRMVVIVENGHKSRCIYHRE